MGGAGVGLFILGLLLGSLLGWRWLGEKRSIVPPAHDLEVIREHAETAEARVRDLEASRDALEARVAALDQERRGLLESVRRAPKNGEAAPAAMPAGVPLPVPTPAAIEGDLTLIRGIGPKLAERLRGLGFTSLRQLAELTPEQVARIDAAIDFPGRVTRERWAEQARDLLRRG